MKFPKDVRVDGCAAREPGRYAINGVLVERAEDGSGRAVATDGRRLVVVPVELEDDDDVPSSGRVVPLEAFKAARAGADRKTGECRIQLNGAAKARGTGGAVLTCDYLEGEFPRYADVIPAADEGAARYAFNAEYLSGLQRAMGAESVRLELAVDAEGRVLTTAPARVTGGPLEGAVGVLMPVTSDSDDAPRREDGAVDVRREPAPAGGLAEWTRAELEAEVERLRAAVVERDELRLAQARELEALRSELERRASPAEPEAFPACEPCRDKVGGAAAGPDAPMRPAEPGEECTAADHVDDDAPASSADVLEVDAQPIEPVLEWRVEKLGRIACRHQWGELVNCGSRLRVCCAPGCGAMLRADEGGDAEPFRGAAPLEHGASSPEAGAPAWRLIPGPGPKTVGVHFDSKPGADVRAALRAAGFRWYGGEGRKWIRPAPGAWCGLRSALPAELEPAGGMPEHVDDAAPAEVPGAPGLEVRGAGDGPAPRSSYSAPPRRRKRSSSSARSTSSKRRDDPPGRRIAW